ncbi:MAG: hypothetical protein IPN01_22040 [Deltaproteobacteria bacterium]|nr:hypothetical protein [Deltaproteobacteria bacterium]
MYRVDPADRTVLIASADARPPEPRQLYIRTPGPQHGEVTYRPNVEFLDAKMYRPHLFGASMDHDLQEGITETVRQGLERNEGLMNNRVTQSREGYSHKIGHHVRKTLKHKLIPAVRGEIRAGNARIGIISPNDCARFAMVLLCLIRDRRIRSSVSTMMSLKPRIAALRYNCWIGDMMMLGYGDGSRHGITCVAVDRSAGQFVTLEANAWKFLVKPEFFIYSSMNELINTHMANDLANPRSLVRFLPQNATHPVIERNIEPANMLAGARELDRLIGKWGKKGYHDIWHMTATAAAVPVLYDRG